MCGGSVWRYEEAAALDGLCRVYDFLHVEAATINLQDTLEDGLGRRLRVPALILARLKCAPDLVRALECAALMVFLLSNALRAETLEHHDDVDIVARPKER